MSKRALVALGVVGIFAAVAFIGWLIAPAEAEDALGCEGLSEYRAAMIEAGENYWAILDDGGISDTDAILTWTPDDWGVFATAATDYAVHLQSIEPPPFAAAWHDVKIDAAGLTINIARAVETGGALVIIGFSGEADKLDAREVDAYNAAIAVCPDFAVFQAEWDAIDGEIDGPPKATPLATPAR